MVLKKLSSNLKLGIYIDEKEPSFYYRSKDEINNERIKSNIKTKKI